MKKSQIALYAGFFSFASLSVFLSYQSNSAFAMEESMSKAESFFSAENKSSFLEHYFEAKKESADVPIAPTQASTSVKTSEYVAKPTSSGKVSISGFNNLVEEISSTYRVSKSRAAYVVTSAFNAVNIVKSEGGSSKLSPFIILGLIQKESSFKANVRVNNMIGETQVIPRWHPEVVKKIGGVSKLSHTPTNVLAGTLVLDKYIDKYDGNLSKALYQYNGFSRKNYPSDVISNARKWESVYKNGA